jgi:hypothetical protein
MSYDEFDRVDTSPLGTPGEEIDPVLSALSDPEPEPGLNGIPVKCRDVVQPMKVI